MLSSVPTRRHPVLVVCVCKSGANKFACNRHKLLELLHGNKLVRTESDNTTRAAWFCLCLCCCCCRYIYSVVIVIRIHVEQTCEWQPCFSYPLDHSCFVAVPAKNTGTDHKKLWILQFQRRNNEDDLEVHRSVREGNNYCLFDRHISITNPQFHGEINDKQEELANGNGTKEDSMGFDFGEISLSAPDYLDYSLLVMESFPPDKWWLVSFPNNNNYINGNPCWLIKINLSRILLQTNDNNLLNFNQ